MSPYVSRNRSSRKKRRAKWPFILLALALVGAGVFWFTRDKQPTTDQAVDLPAQSTGQDDPQPSYTAPDLQPTIDSWVKKYSADYHIQIYDLQADKVIGEHYAEEAVFAASLYKIYVAYFMYKDFQSGNQDPDEILSLGRTKLECADAMIRDSDSPCGEAAMADMGQTTLNKRVSDELGTTATIFNGIETSAADSVTVLKFIHSGKFLTDEYAKKLSDSMLKQDAKFKRGLQAGAPDAKWETKVGWNLDINYHDIGFMTMPDGRKFAVAILGQGSGSPAPIADFAKTIYNELNKQPLVSGS